MAVDERRRTIALVVAGLLLALLAFAIVAWSGSRVNDAFADALKVDTVTWERALDEAIGPIDPTIVASVVGILGLVAFAATMQVTSAARYGWAVGTFLVVALALWKLNELLDYGTCDQPGFNDATAGRVLADRLSVDLAVAWPAVTIATAIARLVLTRRRALLHLAFVVTVAVFGAGLILLVGVSDLC